ncbi:MAG: T9SS type A sorting domain-containing protein, partial [Bacteroidetes bacterium]|nr:T9SS type A sorting domain-containing protein [Bacteroidota bacterium]
ENYPNPFQEDTTIEYELPETAHVRIVVYNVLGQEVAVLVDEEQAAGRYDVRWDGASQTGASVASGVYIYRIEAGDFSATQRATRVR